jgi:hypothetical protein
MRRVYRTSQVTGRSVGETRIATSCSRLVCFESWSMVLSKLSARFARVASRVGDLTGGMAGIACVHPSAMQQHHYICCPCGGWVLRGAVGPAAPPPCTPRCEEAEAHGFLPVTPATRQQNRIVSALIDCNTPLAPQRALYPRESGRSWDWARAREHGPAHKGCGGICNWCCRRDGILQADSDRRPPLRCARPQGQAVARHM